jgi:hypothetical protein
MKDSLDKIACIPEALDSANFNPRTILPYGLKPDHIQAAMQEFIDFLQFVNTQLNSKGILRLESMLMPANFSSMVGEFMGASIPKYCPTLARNQYHNGHPDLVPHGRFTNDAIQYSHEGVEIKASRYEKGWQGHNPEEVFLMVFVFESNGPRDGYLNIDPMPFRFKMVTGAHLEKSDWKFAGRSKDSRRTITASVTKSGYDKMLNNWIYLSPETKNRILPAANA